MTEYAYGMNVHEFPDFADPAGSLARTLWEVKSDEGVSCLWLDMLYGDLDPIGFYEVSIYRYGHNDGWKIIFHKNDEQGSSAECTDYYGTLDQALSEACFLLELHGPGKIFVHWHPTDKKRDSLFETPRHKPKLELDARSLPQCPMWHRPKPEDQMQ